MREFLRHNLLWVLFSLLFLPGFFIILKICFGKHAIPKMLRYDYRLIGVTQKRQPIQLDFAHFKSHEVQKQIENQIASFLPMRSLFIRTNNQIYYSFFRKSYSEDGQLIVGKANQLLVDSYIRTYCHYIKSPAMDNALLTEWADKLKIMNDFFKRHGKTFVYVMTPSKVEYYPQAIPDRYHCNQTGITAHVKKLIALLDERKIPYVNGSELMTQASKKYATPMFPRGGIHWNNLGASVEANAIIAKINEASSLHLKPLRFNFTLIKHPQGSDSDLISIMNLLRPNLHYFIPKMKFSPAPSAARKPITATFIGGSFCALLMDIFIENKTFKKIDYYRYFNLDKSKFERMKIPVISSVSKNLPKVISDILTNDVIILEENAETTVSPHGHWFYDAMKEYAAEKQNLKLRA